MHPLQVLTVHNFYQHAGGEDQVFSGEAALLEQHGHTVEQYTEDNRRIASGIAQAGEAVWSGRSFRALKARVQEAADGVDVVHFHNTFPLISPSAYYAARARSTGGGRPAVVQTLHNYRLICPGATLFRNGTVCESCVTGRTLAPAVMHGCYRDSRPATAAVSAMLAIHRVAGTWRQKVDVYIALSEFARRKFIEGGLPAERIVVKPNFVSMDIPERQAEACPTYALFVGRLAEEKGVRTLAAAWTVLQGTPLVVAGDGPLKGTGWPAGVTALGQQTREQVLALMRGARVLIVPSLCYECAPMTIVEALACGVPVIASDRGSMPEFVADGRTGRLFRAGDAEDLADKVRWAFAHPERMGEMGAAARREYEAKYTAERNYGLLMEIYGRAMEQARGARSAAEGEVVLGS